MTETASKGWHAKARDMWRGGSTESEIAARFQVTISAVQYALRIVKIAEKGMGRGSALSRGQPNSRTRSSANAHDELDCVAMMEAIQNGATGSRRWLKRFAGEEA